MRGQRMGTEKGQGRSSCSLLDSNLSLQLLSLQGQGRDSILAIPRRVPSRSLGTAG